MAGGERTLKCAPNGTPGGRQKCRHKRKAARAEERYMVIGWIVVLFALLVVFFEPAAFKLGQTRFGVIAVAWFWPE